MGGGGDVYEVAQCSLVGRKRGEEERQTEDCGGRTDRISICNNSPSLLFSDARTPAESCPCGGRRRPAASGGRESLEP